VARTRVVEAFKRQQKEIALTALARMGQMSPAYVYAAFFFTYGIKVVGASRDFLLGVLLIGSFFSFFTIPFSGYLSDRFGRKQVYIFGAAATGLFAFAYYALFDTAVPGLIILAVLVGFFFHDLMWAHWQLSPGNVSRRGCATAGRRSAFRSPQCFPADRRRLSRPRCSRRPGRARSSRSTSFYAHSSVSPRPRHY